MDSRVRSDDHSKPRQATHVAGLFANDPQASYDAIRDLLTACTPHQRRRLRSQARSRTRHLSERERNGIATPRDGALLREARLVVTALEGMGVATSRGNNPSDLRAELAAITTELAELQRTPKVRRPAANKNQIRELRARATRIRAELEAEVQDQLGPAGARPPRRATRVHSVVQAGLPGLGRR